MSGMPSPFKSATTAGPAALSTSWSACFSVGLKGAVAVAQVDADPGRAIKLGLPGQDQIDVPIAVQVRRREGKGRHAGLGLGALPEGAIAVASKTVMEPPIDSITSGIPSPLVSPTATQSTPESMRSKRRFFSQHLLARHFSVPRLREL